MIERLFRQVCYNRFFELEVKKAADEGRIKAPIYLSVGQEAVPVGVHHALPNAAIFAQHRCHSWYLTYSRDPRKLRDELLHKESGCAKGMGGSASIHDPSIPMFGHSGLMGDQVPIAVGYAIESGKQTVTVMGDGAAEEDYVLAAMGFAATKKAPILFVVEDNDLAILTEKKVRRSWDHVNIAKSFGLSASYSIDNPITIYNTIKKFDKLPALINISTCRHLWHAGTGTDGPPKHNSYELFKEGCREYRIKVDEIEEKIKKEVAELWQEQ